MSSSSLQAARALAVPTAARITAAWAAPMALRTAQLARLGVHCRTIASRPRAPLALPTVPAQAPTAWSQRPRAQSTTATFDLRAHQGVAFEDLLTYLQEQYGMHQQVVQERMSELARILGYEHVAHDTRITFNDMQILLEEVGTSSAPLRELLRFLRGKQRGLLSDEVVVAEEPEQEADLEEWFRLQNTKDLLAVARRRGATVESVPQGWLRVTTAGGSVVHFKHIGKRDQTRGKREHKEKPPTEKKEAIRVCTQVEDSTVSVLFQQSEVLAGPHELAALVSAGDLEEGADRWLEDEDDEALDEWGEQHSEAALARRTKVPRPDTVMRREDAGQRTRPRRRGPSAAGHVSGRRPGAGAGLAAA